MTTQPSSDPPQTTPRRQQDTLGPSLGIIIVAILVFFAVNGSSNERQGSTREGTFTNTAILTGIDRRITSSDFHSGDASAFMGGINLDFRDATMQGNEATLDVTAIMGGVEIRIPRDWTVVNRVTPILGGVEDHARATDSNKRLIVEGTVLMGGLSIKN